MAKRRPRPGGYASTKPPTPSAEAKREWAGGRRDRFDRFRKAWVSRQSFEHVPRTVWEYKAHDGIVVTVDVTEVVRRMADFVCAVTGVRKLMTPPEYREGPSVAELLPEGLSADERAVFEATAYVPSPRICIDADINFPTAVIGCVTDKLRAELALFFARPSLYERPLDESDDEDDDLYFAPPPRLDLTFATRPALKKMVEENERQECHTPYLVYCEPSFETSGGLLGVAEKRCLIKVLAALDGVTPGVNDWWSLSKRGPRVYYKHASAFRFALFEALLWWKEMGLPPQRVTAAQAAHYLKHFEQMVGDEHTIYHKLKELGLPPWRELKTALSELIDCGRSGDLAKPNSTQT